MAEYVRFEKVRGVLRRALVPVAVLGMAGGGAIIFGSPASAAAPPTTDTLFVVNGSSTTQVPLPAGTPDVMPSLIPALYAACGPIDQAQFALGSLEEATGLVPYALTPSGLNQFGQLSICMETFPKSFAFIIAGTSNIGVANPSGPFFDGSSCVLGLYANNSAAVGIAGPQTFC